MTPTELIQKFDGRLWRTTLDHSPFDVVAWHGNLAPYRYDLNRFNTIEHGQLRSPRPVDLHRADLAQRTRPGTANVDFVIFPPRWMVAEDTFRPPWFHRNVMSEFMGLIDGAYDAKADGFVAGGAFAAQLHVRATARTAPTYREGGRGRSRTAEARQRHGLHVRGLRHDRRHAHRPRLASERL